MMSRSGFLGFETRPAETATPRVSRWLVRWFTWYARRYLRRSFHAVRLAREAGAPDLPRRPTLVCLNHPAWWDPLVCVVLARHLFPERTHFAPMDAAALRRYRFFGKLGFFPLETGGLRGARSFLRTGLAVLSDPDAVLWLTPQGRFADVRERPVALKGGVGRLLSRAPSCTVLPLAVEYVFWNERLPEALVRCGPALRLDPPRPRTPAAYTDLLARRLEETLDALAADAARRDPAAFTTLLRGRVGVGGVYDLWRRLAAWARGRRWQGAHEEIDA
jgi:1-acyl-sn-glycerol-3-phosphate acyltransferase